MARQPWVLERSFRVARRCAAFLEHSEALLQRAPGAALRRCADGHDLEQALRGARLAELVAEAAKL